MTPNQILHKMKSPLTSLLGYTSMIERRFQQNPTDPKINEWLSKIKENANILKEMIEQLESYNKGS